jgi:hypothetical protein
LVQPLSPLVSYPIMAASLQLQSQYCLSTYISC